MRKGSGKSTLVLKLVLMLSFVLIFSVAESGLIEKLYGKQKPKSIMDVECVSEEGVVQKGVACLFGNQTIQITTKFPDPIDPDPDVVALFDSGHFTTFTFGFFIFILDRQRQ